MAPSAPTLETAPGYPISERFQVDWNRSQAAARVERVTFTGAHGDELAARIDRARLLEIADKCPVHRTFHSEVLVESRLAD